MKASMENKQASHRKLFTVNLLVEESLKQYAEQQKTTEPNQNQAKSPTPSNNQNQENH
jgi:hypothetical protein